VAAGAQPRDPPGVPRPLSPSGLPGAFCSTHLEGGGSAFREFIFNSSERILTGSEPKHSRWVYDKVACLWAGWMIRILVGIRATVGK